MPKFRRGDEVITPDGAGVIDSLSLVGVDTFYEVDGQYYSEYELQRP